MTPKVALPVNVQLAGTNGQISLGKQFAGRQVLIEEQETGVWLVRTATVVPDNEGWLHAPGAADDLVKALAWASAHAPSETLVGKTLIRLANAKAW